MRSHLEQRQDGTERVYSISPVGAIAQELVVLGGLESWIRSKNTN